MPQRTAPDLSIQIEISSKGSSAVLKDAGGEELPTEADLHQGELSDLHLQLSEDLRNFKNELGGQLNQLENWDALSNAFRILHKRGTRLLGKLFGAADLGRVVSMFERIIFPARAGKRFPVIDVNMAAADFIPLEFLPVLGGAPPGRIESYEKLVEVAQQFLGFCAVTRRSFRPWDTKNAPMVASETGDSLYLENDPRLPLKFFFCSGLPGAESEAEFFRSGSHAFDVDGPWPDSPMSANDLAAEFARCVCDETAGFDKKLRERADQVHHFACHFTLSRPTGRSFLKLGHGACPPTNVMLGDIEYYLTLIARAGGLRKRPFVFANACGTSVIDPGAATSFPRVMLNNGSIGFLGAETDIPDKVATEFSKRFYRYLLGGYTLGDSVMRTKWDLLRSFHNPLGILYKLYGDPDLRVRQRTDL